MNNAPDKIKLAICDDHALFRNGVSASLKPYNNIQLVCEAESGEVLLTQIPIHHPQVILLDINMPNMDGLETCKLIKATYPNIHVIGLSLHEQIYYITGMFKAGASSYLLKNVDPAEMVIAIQKVINTGYYLHDQIPIGLIKNLIKMDHPALEQIPKSSNDLKEREIELLRLITAELTNNEIALKLNLSPVTIENYRNQLLKKTGAKNTAGLVTYAIKKGYVIL